MSAFTLESSYFSNTDPETWPYRPGGLTDLPAISDAPWATPPLFRAQLGVDFVASRDCTGPGGEGIFTYKSRHAPVFRFPDRKPEVPKYTPTLVGCVASFRKAKGYEAPIWQLTLSLPLDAGPLLHQIWQGQVATLQSVAEARSMIRSARGYWLKDCGAGRTEIIVTMPASTWRPRIGVHRGHCIAVNVWMCRADAPDGSIIFALVATEYINYVFSHRETCRAAAPMALEIESYRPQLGVDFVATRDSTGQTGDHIFTYKSRHAPVLRTPNRKDEILKYHRPSWVKSFGVQTSGDGFFAWPSVYLLLLGACYATITAARLRRSLTCQHGESGVDVALDWVDKRETTNPVIIVHIGASLTNWDFTLKVGHIHVDAAQMEEGLRLLPGRLTARWQETDDRRDFLPTDCREDSSLRCSHDRCSRFSYKDCQRALEYGGVFHKMGWRALYYRPWILGNVAEVQDRIILSPLGLLKEEHCRVFRIECMDTGHRQAQSLFDAQFSALQAIIDAETTDDSVTLNAWTVSEGDRRFIELNSPRGGLLKEVYGETFIVGTPVTLFLFLTRDECWAETGLHKTYTAWADGMCPVGDLEELAGLAGPFLRCTWSTYIFMLPYLVVPPSRLWRLPPLGAAQLDFDFVATRDVEGPRGESVYTYKACGAAVARIARCRQQPMPYTPALFGQILNIEQRDSGYGRMSDVELCCPLDAGDSLSKLYNSQISKLRDIVAHEALRLGYHLRRSWVAESNSFIKVSLLPWSFAPDLTVGCCISFDVGLFRSNWPNDSVAYGLVARDYVITSVTDLELEAAGKESLLGFFCDSGPNKRSSTFPVSHMAAISDVLTADSDSIGRRVLALDMYAVDYRMTRDNSVVVDGCVVHQFSCKDAFMLIASLEDSTRTRRALVCRYQPWIVGQVHSVICRSVHRIGIPEKVAVDCYIIALKCPDTADNRSREFFSMQVAALEGMLFRDGCAVGMTEADSWLGSVVNGMKTIQVTFLWLVIVSTVMMRNWNGLGPRWCFVEGQHMSLMLRLHREDGFSGQRHTYTAWVEEFSVLVDEDLDDPLSEMQVLSMPRSVAQLDAILRLWLVWVRYTPAQPLLLDMSFLTPEDHVRSILKSELPGVEWTFDMDARNFDVRTVREDPVSAQRVAALRKAHRHIAAMLQLAEAQLAFHAALVAPFFSTSLTSRGVEGFTGSLASASDGGLSFVQSRGEKCSSLVDPIPSCSLATRQPGPTFLAVLQCGLCEQWEKWNGCLGHLRQMLGGWSLTVEWDTVRDEVMEAAMARPLMWRSLVVKELDTLLRGPLAIFARSVCNMVALEKLDISSRYPWSCNQPILLGACAPTEVVFRRFEHPENFVDLAWEKVQRYSEHLTRPRPSREVPFAHLSRMIALVELTLYGVLLPSETLSVPLLTRLSLFAPWTTEPSDMPPALNLHCPSLEHLTLGGSGYLMPSLPCVGSTIVSFLQSRDNQHLRRITVPYLKSERAADTMRLCPGMVLEIAQREWPWCIPRFFDIPCLQYLASAPQIAGTITVIMPREKMDAQAEWLRSLESLLRQQPDLSVKLFVDWSTHEGPWWKDVDAAGPEADQYRRKCVRWGPTRQPDQHLHEVTSIEAGGWVFIQDELAAYRQLVSTHDRLTQEVLGNGFPDGDWERGEYAVGTWDLTPGWSNDIRYSTNWPPVEDPPSIPWKSSTEEVVGEDAWGGGGWDSAIPGLCIAEYTSCPNFVYGLTVSDLEQSGQCVWTVSGSNRGFNGIHSEQTTPNRILEESTAQVTIVEHVNIDAGRRYLHYVCFDTHGNHMEMNRRAAAAGQIVQYSAAYGVKSASNRATSSQPLGSQLLAAIDEIVFELHLVLVALFDFVCVSWGNWKMQLFHWCRSGESATEQGGLFRQGLPSIGRKKTALQEDVGFENDSTDYSLLVIHEENAAPALFSGTSTRFSHNSLMSFTITNTEFANIFLDVAMGFLASGDEHLVLAATAASTLEEKAELNTAAGAYLLAADCYNKASRLQTGREAADSLAEAAQVYLEAMDVMLEAMECDQMDVD
ncbi:hypothetical protein C8R43DRAFT_963105 [Mycena crocata]|nr:hypothetical protein C8R43DRAFT_963105 [Mycena crocata]